MGALENEWPDRHLNLPSQRCHWSEPSSDDRQNKVVVCNADGNGVKLISSFSSRIMAKTSGSLKNSM